MPFPISTTKHSVSLLDIITWKEEGKIVRNHSQTLELHITFIEHDLVSNLNPVNAHNRYYKKRLADEALDPLDREIVRQTRRKMNKTWDKYWQAALALPSC
jgi:hypothetical protein